MKKVLIIANGPSYNTLDVEEIKIHREHYVIACVNYYPTKSENDFLELKPDYLFLFDPIFFSRGTTLKDERQQLYNMLLNITWNMNLVIPKGIEYKISNKYINIEYLNMRQIRRKPNKLNMRLMDKNLLTIGYQTVACGALYYFLMNNYTSIYLIGIDISDFRNYHVDKDNRVYVQSEHFYGKTRDKFYYDEHEGYVHLKMYQWLDCFVNMLRQFDYYEEYAKYKNATIYNLSMESYIDSFRKINQKDIDYSS